MRIILNRYLILLLIFFLPVACSPQPTPTPFRPPTQSIPTQIPVTLTPTPRAVINTVAPSSSPTIVVTPTDGPCSNDLDFLQDITIPDGTTVSIGASIDKQWLITNSGTCNWDSSYRLKWIGGDPLGAEQEQSLFPARAGTQATLRILFTAPSVEGTYESSWQAYDPDGNPFGDPVYMQIIVAP